MRPFIGSALGNPLVLILIAVALGAVGQIFIQMGANRIGEVTALGFSPKLFKLMFSPEVLSGMFIYAVSAVLYVIVVSKRGIGYAYPFVALNQVIILLISWLLFGQTPPSLRVIGVLLICAGMLCVARGG